jgi:hypothetical protein
MVSHHFLFFLLYSLLSLTLYLTMVQNVGKVIVYASTIMATGYGLMVFTVPDEAEMRRVSTLCC